MKAREITANVIELTTKYYTASITIHLLDLLESHASGTRSQMEMFVCMYMYLYIYDVSMFV